MNFNNQSTGGQWLMSEIEQANNINYLELQAIFLGIKCFFTKLSNKHIKVMCDDATAVAYVNNLGGTKSRMCVRTALQKRNLSERTIQAIYELLEMFNI